LAFIRACTSCHSNKRSERDLSMEACRVVFGYSAMGRLGWNFLRLIREIKEYVKYMRDLNRNAGVNIDGRFEYFGWGGGGGHERNTAIPLCCIRECG